MLSSEYFVSYTKGYAIYTKQLNRKSWIRNSGIKNLEIKNLEIKNLEIKNLEIKNWGTKTQSKPYSRIEQLTGQALEPDRIESKSFRK